MVSSFAPGSLAELMTMTPDAYRPELVSAAQIEQHLAELDGRWFSEDNAVFGMARELAERHPTPERRAWWHTHIGQRWRDLQAEQQRRIDESKRFEAEYNARQKAERQAAKERQGERTDTQLVTNLATSNKPKKQRATDQTAPKPRPNRAQNTAPIWHQIPAELQARPQWVLWRYQPDANGKPTKVPYNARTAKPASTTAPSSWATFANAKAAYLARPDYFDGVGYVFCKEDPYCGADFDHCLEAGQPTSWAAAHLAALRSAGAYIEVSVSETGVHAITRASVGKGCKTPRGEVYDRGRFFTISGQALEPTAIADGQAAIDALLAELRGPASAKAIHEGKPGTKDRAALLAEIPTDMWETARALQRTQRDLLLKRALAATQKEETQGYFAARLLWAELHQRWAHIGVYRADGSLDDSQARAVLARTLYGRGFTFPQYVVIMSHHFAAYCLAKWGTKERWREELAACWHDAAENTSYRPKAPAGKPAPDVAISAKPRGRASSHAHQVERVYQLLLDHRAGTQALVNTQDLASAADMHRVTLAGILAELRSAGRIETRRNGRYGGLIVAFPDVAIVCEPAAEYGAAMLETPIKAAAPIEETSTNSKACVSSELREAGYSLQVAPLAALAAAYLDNPDAGAIALRNRATGESTRRHSAKHFAQQVCEHYGEHYSADEARVAYKAEQARRAALEKAEWARFFAQLKAMPTPDLIAYIHGGCRRELAELARNNDNGAAFDKHKYRTRLKCAKQHLGWRGVALPAKPTKSKAYTPTKPQRPRAAPKARPVACQPLRFEQPKPANADAAGLIARLRARKEAQQERL